MVLAGHKRRQVNESIAASQDFRRGERSVRAQPGGRFDPRRQHGQTGQGMGNVGNQPARHLADGGRLVCRLAASF